MRRACDGKGKNDLSGFPYCNYFVHVDGCGLEVGKMKDDMHIKNEIKAFSLQNTLH